jgi:hypothetical protein
MALLALSLDGGEGSMSRSSVEPQVHTAPEPIWALLAKGIEPLDRAVRSPVTALPELSWFFVDFVIYLTSLSV